MPEPIECLIADAMLDIMRKWMPENGQTYLEYRMLWGAIHREMIDKASAITKAA